MIVFSVFIFDSRLTFDILECIVLRCSIKLLFNVAVQATTAHGVDEAGAGTGGSDCLRLIDFI